MLRTTIGATATGTLAVHGGGAVPFEPDDLQLFTLTRAHRLLRQMLCRGAREPVGDGWIRQGS